METTVIVNTPAEKIKKYRYYSQILEFILCLVMLVSIIYPLVLQSKFKNIYFNTICNYNNSNIFYYDNNGNNITLETDNHYQKLVIPCFVSRYDKYDIIMSEDDYSNNRPYYITIYCILSIIVVMTIYFIILIQLEKKKLQIHPFVEMKESSVNLSDIHIENNQV